MRQLAAIALLIVISPWASAQRMSGLAPHSGVPASPGFTGAMRPGFAGNGFARAGFGHGNRGFERGVAIPFFSDALYSDLLASGYPSALQPPVFVMQTPPSASSAAVFPTPKDPLVIELQGDRYVQVGGDAKSTAEVVDLEPTSAKKEARPAASTLIRASQNENLIATLVYRDGHREDISDYTITNGAIYAKTDYYKSGAWNRRIDISSLNLPETVQVNQSRGLKFHLPSSPNEVVVGP